MTAPAEGAPKGGPTALGQTASVLKVSADSFPYGINVDGLGNITVKAFLQVSLFIALHGEGGQSNNRDSPFGFGLDLFHRLYTAYIRQLDVHQHQVDFPLQGSSHTIPAEPLGIYCVLPAAPTRRSSSLYSFHHPLPPGSLHQF